MFDVRDLKCDVDALQLEVAHKARKIQELEEAIVQKNELIVSFEEEISKRKIRRGRRNVCADYRRARSYQTGIGG